MYGREQQKWKRERGEKNYVVILSQHLCRCELVVLPLLLLLQAGPAKVIYDKLYIHRMRVLSKFPLDYKASLVHNIWTMRMLRIAVTPVEPTEHIQCSDKLLFFFVGSSLRVLNSIRDILLDRLCKRLNFMKISTCTEIKEIRSTSPRQI